VWMIKTLMWSVLLYGSETSLRKEDIKRLEACEMWFWRRLLKISCQKHATDETVLERIRMSRCLINTIKRRKTIWLGHVLRHDNMLRHAIEGRMEGKRTRGRKRMMLLHMMKKEKGDNYQYLKTRALARTLQA